MMSMFMTKQLISIIPGGSKEIKSFCQTGQFWFKTTQLNVLVELPFLNMV